MINTLKHKIHSAISDLFQQELEASKIQLGETRKEFEGDYTLVCFPLLSISRKNPEETGKMIGAHLVDSMEEITAFNVIKGFLNLSLSDECWHRFLHDILQADNYGKGEEKAKRHLVESCSPNTNKPLHLGHIRNILLGDAVYRILEYSGTEVKRVQIINDRGIAICKSMLAWSKYAEGRTPEQDGQKPDHFVGKYYVLFDQKFKEEYSAYQETEEAEQWFLQDGKKEESKDAFFKRNKNNYFNSSSQLGKEAREMLLKWEASDPEVKELWNRMNSWVYEGFDQTYESLDVAYDHIYYESDMYLKGRDLVLEALNEGTFFQEEDGSIWVDLTEQGLDKKIMLRADGTSVYITQDIGTAVQRYDDYQMNAMTYVVGNEQNYHFQVLFEVLKLLGYSFSNDLHHLSYGMVELPDGKMKSREGTVVDADDLIAEVIGEANEGISERVTSLGLNEDGRRDLAKLIGLSALKYFILKVNPKKGMVFNPSESVDLQGQTGPYIQYSFVRINGLLERVKRENIKWSSTIHGNSLQGQEKQILSLLAQFPNIVEEAAQQLDPSVIANYSYALARAYHKFWSDVPILSAETEEISFRVALSAMTGKVIKRAMGLLGIEMPTKM